MSARIYIIRQPDPDEDRFLCAMGYLASDTGKYEWFEKIYCDGEELKQWLREEVLFEEVTP